MHTAIRTLTIASRCLTTAFVVIVADDLVTEVTDLPWRATMLTLLLGFAAQLAAGRLRRRRESAVAGPVEVEPPVAGRWLAMNSPATRTPSHGVRVYGQAYAIDVVAEPEAPAEGPTQVPAGGPATRPPFGWWPLMRRNRDFPAFGQPLLAVADATVVHAVDNRRDHLSRTSLPALLYLFLVEGLVRDTFGASLVLGNHVVLDLGNGVYAAYAHLKRGSLTVRPGETVHAGQPIARCGNSGNSTEPHLHFQLMDHPHPDAACGVPFTWRGVGVPANGQHFSAAPTVLKA